MSDDASQPQLPRERRRLSCGMMALGCFGTIMLLLLLGALSIWLYFRGRHQRGVREVQTEVARIQAAGEPITTADMVAWHRVPEGVFDATPLWLAAIRSAASIKDPNESKLPVLGNAKIEELSADAPQSLLPMAEQFLAAHGETIAKTRQAAAAGGQCRYPIDFSKGQAALLPHIQEARTLARVLSLKLHVAVAKRDAAGAAEALKLQLALARTMDHEPLLVTQLVRMAVIGIALADVRRAVSELPLAEPQLAELQKKIEAIDVRQAIKNGLIGERALGFHTFHHLSQVEGLEILAGEEGELQRPGDCAVYLGLMQELIGAADLPPQEARQISDKVESKLKARIGSQNPLDRLEIVVTMLMFPATGSSLDASARTLAQRDSAAAGIAFRRYQLKYGRPPDSLEALVPEFLPAVPRDPYAAGSPPLILVVNEEQFAIYSVGTNLQDDQSLFSDPESLNDIGFVAKVTVPGDQADSKK